MYENASTPARQVYQAVSDALRAEGVSTVFALMGDGNLELLADLAERTRMPLVHARHEQGAVAMADGYARFSGAVGVASVTHGPGLSNTATSLLTAAAARTPLVLIAADTPTADPHHPQAFDQVTFSRVAGAAVRALRAPVTACVDLGEAFRQARQERRPVVLNAPSDVLRDNLPATTADHLPTAAVPPRSVPDPAAVRAAVHALRTARRPAILAGLGAVLSADAEVPLAQLAERLGAPVITTLMAHGLLADAPSAVGVAGGLGAGRGSAALRVADCVLAVGASVNAWTTDGRLGPDAVLVHIDADPGAIGRYTPTQIPLVGDACLALLALLDVLGEPDATRPMWMLDSHTTSADGGTPAGDGLPPREVIAALDRALPDRRLLVVDAGHFSGFAQQGLRSSHPREYTFTHQFGAIGQGLGTAIGAAVARPGERVTAILGDGCLLMAVAELDTLARYQLPVTVFVMNDESYGQERHALSAKGFSPREAVFATPALAPLAEAFGIPGYRIDTPEALEALPIRLAAADGPLLVDARIDSGIQNRSFSETAARLRGTSPGE